LFVTHSQEFGVGFFEGERSYDAGYGEDGSSNAWKQKRVVFQNGRAVAHLVLDTRLGEESRENRAGHGADAPRQVQDPKSFGLVCSAGDDHVASINVQTPTLCRKQIIA
jgi:hypothetical protein